MYQSSQLTNTTPFAKSSSHRPQWRLAFRLIVLVFASFALSPAARAVSPPPDGGYPNSNTAEGDNALLSLTTGFGNTALGFNALYSDVQAGGNTAIGIAALYFNNASNNTAIGGSTLTLNTSGDNNTAVGAT